MGAGRGVLSELGAMTREKWLKKTRHQMLMTKLITGDAPKRNDNKLVVNPQWFFIYLYI